MTENSEKGKNILLNILKHIRLTNKNHKLALLQ